MSKNIRWSADDMKKKGLVQNAKGDFVPVKSLVNTGKVEKIDAQIMIPKGMTDFQKENVPYRGLKVEKITSFQLEVIQKVESRDENKKVRNATKITENGISFDSKLEKYMYDLLRGAYIPFEFQKVFILQAKFRYRTENVRAIYKVVDFWLPIRGIIIDTKGYSNDVSPMKHKMLKYALMNNYGIMPEIVMPKDKKECDALLNRLLFEK